MDKVCSFPHTTVSQVTRVRNLANTDVWHSKWRKIIPALCQSQKHSRSLLADRPSFWLIAFSLLRSLTWEPALWKSHLTWIRVNKFSPDSICFSSIYYYEFLLLLFLYEFFRQSLRLPVLVICFVDVNFHNFYKYRSASRRDEAFIESKDFIAITRSKTFPTSFSDPLIALLTPSLTLSSSEKKEKRKQQLGN